MPCECVVMISSGVMWKEETREAVSVMVLAAFAMNDLKVKGHEEDSPTQQPAPRFVLVFKCSQGSMICSNDEFASLKECSKMLNGFDDCERFLLCNTVAHFVFVK